MENSNEKKNSQQTNDRSLQNLRIRTFAWCAFAAGVVATVLVVYLGILQPMNRQFAQLQLRLRKLDRSVREVVGEKGSLEATNSLLALLVKQRAEVGKAAAVLSEFADLKRDVLAGEQNLARAQKSVADSGALLKTLVSQRELTSVGREAVTAMDEMRSTVRTLQEGITQANERLGKLVALKDRLNDEETTVKAAQETLDALVVLKNNTLDQASDLQGVRDVVAEWDTLHAHLARSVKVTSDARRASDEMLDLHAKLISHSDKVDVARSALEDLLDIRTRLENQEHQTRVAASRVDELLTLKDNVLAHTDDLADAIEMMEITDDLHEQYRLSATTIRNVRIGLVEILALAPMFEHAMQVLTPLTELSNLRRLDRDELQQLASTILSKRQDRLTSESEASKAISAKTTSPARQPAAVATRPEE